MMTVRIALTGRFARRRMVVPDVVMRINEAGRNNRVWAGEHGCIRIPRQIAANINDLAIGIDQNRTVNEDLILGKNRSDNNRTTITYRQNLATIYANRRLRRWTMGRARYSA